MAEFQPQKFVTLDQGIQLPSDSILRKLRVPKTPVVEYIPRINVDRSVEESIKLLDPEVLVISGSIGMGHVRAAQAFTKAFSSAYPEIRIGNIDAMQLVGGMPRALYSAGYMKCGEKFPHVLGAIYDLSDSPNSVSGAALLFDRFIGRGLERLLRITNPPVVVATHFLASRLVGALKENGSINSKLLQVVTDFDLHSYWLVNQTDHYFVGGDPARQRLKHFGVPESKITLTGIPIDAAFSMQPPKEQARHQLNLEPNKKTLLLSLGGQGLVTLPKIVESLSKMNTELQVLVVCGKNVAAKKDIDAFVATLPQDHKVQFNVFGFTDKMPLLMAASDIMVGKPGGLTTSEALASGLVLVLVNPIPGQEDHNADYLLEQGAAVRCRYFDQLPSKIEALLSDSEALNQRAAISKKLGNPQAAQDVASMVKERLDMQHQKQFGFDRNMRKELRALLLENKDKARIAAFDLDNTILDGDIGESGFRYLSEQGLIQGSPIFKGLATGAQGTEIIFSPKPGETANALYERAIAESRGQTDEAERFADIYCWMTTSLAGKSVKEILSATGKAWREHTESGALKLRQSTLEVLAEAIQLGYMPVVVSASNVWSVRWVVRNVINRSLRRDFGVAGIPSSNVFGVATQLQLGTSIVSPYQPSKFWYTPTQRSAKLTDVLILPTTTFSGKRALFEQHLKEKPFIAFGDSANDKEMLSIADVSVLVSQPGKEEFYKSMKAELEGRGSRVFVARDW